MDRPEKALRKQVTDLRSCLNKRYNIIMQELKRDQPSHLHHHTPSKRDSPTEMAPMTSMTSSAATPNSMMTTPTVAHRKPGYKTVQSSPVKPVRISQWNCKGFARRLAELDLQFQRTERASVLLLLGTCPESLRFR